MNSSLEETLQAVEEAKAGGDITKALEILGEASLSFGDDPSSIEALRLLRELGLVHRLAGDIDESRRAYTRALEGARALGETEEEAFALNGLAVATHIGGDLEAADEQYARAARLAAAAGLIRLCGMIDQNRGVIANTRGDLAGAARRYRAALTAFEMTRDAQGVAWTQNNLGMLATDRGDPAQAFQRFARAQEAAEEAQDKELQVRVRINHAEALLLDGQREAAEASLRVALEGAAESNYDLLEAEASTLLASTLREGGNPAAGVPRCQRAMEIARQAPDVLLLAEALRECARCHEDLGDSDSARICLEEAATHFDALGAEQDLADVLARLGSVQDAAQPSGTPPA